MKKSLIIIAVILIIVLASVSWYFFFFKPDISAYYSDGGYSDLPGKSPSVEITMTAVYLLDDIDKNKRDEIDSFLDTHVPSYCDINNTCSYSFLYRFVITKEKLGYSEQDIMKKYGMDEIVLDRIRKYNNTIFEDGQSDFLSLQWLHAMNIFQEIPLIDKNTTEFIVVRTINAVESNDSVFRKALLVVRPMELTGFHSVDELKIIQGVDTTRLEYLCTLPELNKNVDICSANQYLMVKDFCGEKLSEMEKNIVSNLLSREYLHLSEKSCKKVILTELSNMLL